MYAIVNWNTKEVISTTDNLSAAKRKCRRLGFNVKNDQKSPVAFVGKQIEVYDKIMWGVVYNPHFE